MSKRKLPILLLALLLAAPAYTQQAEQAQRRAKAAYLWQRVAPWSYSPALVEHFVSEHERLGIGPEWLASMSYGMANFGLSVGKRAPGRCFGPMDVRWPGYARQAGCRRPDDLRDPYRNITAHCLEARAGVRRGHTGLALCRWIMMPSRPHDWGRGKFRKAWARHVRLIAQGYAAGKITPGPAGTAATSGEGE